MCRLAIGLRRFPRFQPSLRLRLGSKSQGGWFLQGLGLCLGFGLRVQLVEFPINALISQPSPPPAPERAAMCGTDILLSWKGEALCQADDVSWEPCETGR